MWDNPSLVPAMPGYRPQAKDTSRETDIFEFSLLRQKSDSDRLLMSAALTKGARQLCLYGLRQSHSHWSELEFSQQIARAFLGENCPPRFTPTGNEMTWIQDSIALAVQLHDIFEALTIPYYITGGVAAATYGEPRTTRDLDAVIALALTDLDRLLEHLQTQGFYIPGIEEIRSGQLQILGITHTETIARADLIIAGQEEFERQKFTRRRALTIPDRGTFYLVSPEDLILHKLLWGRESRSEKQWRDVLGILKIQGNSLDFVYLRQWSENLGIDRSLALALREAGLGG
jgi:hypothetical protein